MARIIALDNLQQFAAVNALSTDLGAIPGPVLIPQCAQIVLSWNLPDAKTGHTVWYGRYSGAFAGTVAHANAIHTALSTGAQWTALAPFLHTTAILNGVTIRNVAVIDQPILQSTTPGAAGTAAGGPLPSEVAAVVTLRTALAGRANRGRSYIPGFASAALFAGDVIIAAAVTALQNWAGTWIGALSPSGYTLVIGQRARAAYTSPVTARPFAARPANSVQVTACVVRDNHWDSQRRRGLK
jgi:hypothetical protein